VIVAVIAVPIALWRGPRVIAGAALAALVIAAILTISEARTTNTQYNTLFAARRPLAAEAGRAAGVLILVSLGVALERERRSSSAPPDISRRE
jgi:hypothetical protein